MADSTSNCLAGCVNKYYVEPLWNNAPINTGAKSDSFAPYVSVRLSSGGNEITVGNESYPSNPNTAVVKSIEYGFIDKNEGKIEIVDEEGGELSIFLDAVAKCMKSVGQGSIITFKVGWIYTTCDGGSNMIPGPGLSSVVLSIESSISNGIIKFIINFGPVEAIEMNKRYDKTFGTESDPIKLEEAINQLAQLDDPINVKYAWYDQSGKIRYGSHEWVNHGEGGPKAAWRADNQTKYAAIAKWIESYRVKDGKEDKGVVLIHDPEHPKTLTILRNPNPVCGEIEFPNQLHLGTFIVNGGKCSNVLEFNPTLNFVNATGTMAAGGGTSGPLKSNQEFKEDEKLSCNKPHGENAGPQIQTTPNDSSVFTDGANAIKETNKSQESHAEASKLVEISASPIDAELRLVGIVDSRFHKIIAGYTCSIVVINPFTIKGGFAGSSCGDFLKRADCHPWFSNSNWMVMGVNHAVQEGSFVTTLKVKLAVPGLGLDGGSTIGANSTGVQTKSTC